MIAPVGTLVRHTIGRRRGRVVYSPTPGVTSTLVDFGKGDVFECPDGELEEIPNLDSHEPTITSDGTHCHISSGPEWSAELREFFNSNGVRCVVSPRGVVGMDLVDFGTTDAETYQRIQELFGQWLQSHAV